MVKFNAKIIKKQNPNGFMEYIDFYDGSIKIGMAQVRKDGNHIYIEAMGVRSQHRGKGYGRKIVKYLENRIRKFNTKMTFLDPLDKQAESFWKHFGYEQYPDSDYLYKRI